MRREERGEEYEEEEEEEEEGEGVHISHDGDYMPHLL